MEPLENPPDDPLLSWVLKGKVTPIERAVWNELAENFGAASRDVMVKKAITGHHFNLEWVKSQLERERQPSSGRREQVCIQCKAKFTPGNFSTDMKWCSTCVKCVCAACWQVHFDRCGIRSHEKIRKEIALAAAKNGATAGTFERLTADFTHAFPGRDIEGILRLCLSDLRDAKTQLIREAIAPGITPAPSTDLEPDLPF